MGVKKKHETFEENSMNEQATAKTNRIVPNDWLHPPYRNQASSRNMQTQQAVNGGESHVYLNKQVELMEISHGHINATSNNKNYNNYNHQQQQQHLSVYDRENMSSHGESRTNKHTQQSQRNTRTTYHQRNDRNQQHVESSSNANAQPTIIISDEEDDDDEMHNQENDYGKIFKF